MTRLPIPAVWFEDRRWSPAELGGAAAAWRARVRAEAPAGGGLIAAVLDNHVEGITLLLALAPLPWSVVVLGPDPRTWRSAPPLPASTPIVLTPRWAPLAGAAAERGHPVIALPAERGAPGEPTVEWSLPGMVGFTSGSTGLPKPVYRRGPTILQSARASAEVLGLGAGDHTIGVLPLATLHGITTTLLHAIGLGTDAALLERFDHRALLALFATGRYAYLSCTPIMAAAVARCPLGGPAPPSPRVVRVSGGPLPPDVFDAYARRFGVPLRPAWGSTEGGVMTVEGRAAGALRPDGVGLAVPGVVVRVGDDPARPAAAGEVGRVWYRSDQYMAGYGFPPDVEPAEQDGGWFPSGDRGALDAHGCLVLAGRVDDSFKTPSGHLVSPGEIVAALSRCPGVTAVEVLPLARALGADIGVLVEGVGVSEEAVRAHAAACLPAWAQPHALRVVAAIPRTAHGKVDQLAGRDLLAADPA